MAYPHDVPERDPNPPEREFGEEDECEDCGSRLYLDCTCPNCDDGEVGDDGE